MIYTCVRFVGDIRWTDGRRHVGHCGDTHAGARASVITIPTFILPTDEQSDVCFPKLQFKPATLFAFTGRNVLTAATCGLWHFVQMVNSLSQQRRKPNALHSSLSFWRTCQREIDFVELTRLRRFTRKRKIFTPAYPPSATDGELPHSVANGAAVEPSCASVEIRLVPVKLVRFFFR